MTILDVRQTDEKGKGISNSFQPVLMDERIGLVSWQQGSEDQMLGLVVGAHGEGTWEGVAKKMICK